MRSRIRLKLLLWIHLVDRLPNVINKDPPDPISTTHEHIHLTQNFMIDIHRIMLSHPLRRYTIRVSQMANKIASTDLALR